MCESAKWIWVALDFWSDSSPECEVCVNGCQASNHWQTELIFRGYILFRASKGRSNQTTCGNTNRQFLQIMTNSKALDLHTKKQHLIHQAAKYASLILSPLQLLNIPIWQTDTDWRTLRWMKTFERKQCSIWHMRKYADCWRRRNQCSIQGDKWLTQQRTWKRQN